MEREEILKIEHVSKRYKLGMIGGTTLFSVTGGVS